MTIFLKLSIPNKIVPRIRVLPDQCISILNQIKLFSNNNKMIFISKGIILPYMKSFNECNIHDGDIIYGLYINEENSNVSIILSSSDQIDLKQINNHVLIFGPHDEANLTSINKTLLQSQNSTDINRILSLKNKSVINEIAKLNDLKALKFENNRYSWMRKQKNLVKQKTIFSSSNCVDLNLSSINYDPPKEPCCEALPIIL